MIRAFPGLTAAALLLALPACAGASGYPSLERRPAERIAGTAEPATPAPRPEMPPAPPSPELAGRLTQLVEQARTAHQRFIARRGDAERLISAARGAAVGSEHWSVASVALAELESARSDAMLPLAELDELYTEKAVAASSGALVGDAQAAQQQVGAWIAEEDQVLARLRASL